MRRWAKQMLSSCNVKMWLLPITSDPPSAAVLYWIMADVKVINESHKISDKRGNGCFFELAWTALKEHK